MAPILWAVMHFQEDVGCCALHRVVVKGPWCCPTNRESTTWPLGSDVAPRSALHEGRGDEKQEWSGLGTAVRRAVQQSQFILDLHSSWA